MSSEQTHFSDAFPDSENEERIRVISALAVEAVEEINKLGQGYPEAYRDALSYMTRGARLSQFEVLTSAVIEVAKNQIIEESPFYLLDDVHFQVLESELKSQGRLSDFFEAHTEASRQAIADGMREGTDDFLRVLVPEAITEIDPERRETFFIPWRKDLLDKIDPCYMNENEDESCEVFLPTRLPDIYVIHSYAPVDDALPVEEIRLLPNLTNWRR